METYASTELDETFQAHLEGGPLQSNMRIISVRVNDELAQKKDPVYFYIFQITRTEFRPLLHEAPLYVLGRSLLVESESLYQQAIRLYRTRNQIVHRGEILDGPEDVFEFSRSDAIAGVQTALDVCG